jgi:hypothetical protein
MGLPLLTAKAAGIPAAATPKDPPDSSEGPTIHCRHGWEELKFRPGMGNAITAYAPQPGENWSYGGGTPH